MNIEIHLRKENMDSDPEIILQFGDVTQTQKIINQEQKLHMQGLEHNCDTELSVRRDSKELYQTSRNHHDNKIFIDKVIVDDFWEFDDSFYPPTTIFDKEYMDHLDKVGTDQWMKNTVNNTHLFFNGRLTWDIKYPVRRSFFKDLNR